MNSITLLEKLLSDDFPRATLDIREGNSFKVKSRESYQLDADNEIACKSFSWSAAIKGKKLTIDIKCHGKHPVMDEIFLGIDDNGDNFPCLFHACSNGKKYVVPDGACCKLRPDSAKWGISLQLPEKLLPGNGFSNLRLNIVRFTGNYHTRDSWPCDCIMNDARLNLVFYDPANMGDLV